MQAVIKGCVVGIDEVQQLIDRVVTEAWSDAAEADFSVREVVVSRFQIGWNSRTAAMLLGSSDTFEPFETFVSDDVFDRLRNLTYVPDVGAWFNFRLHVTVEDVTAEYDFDGRPEFSLFMVTADDVAVEFENWPRDEAHTPGWLVDIVDSFSDFGQI